MARNDRRIAESALDIVCRVLRDGDTALERIMAFGPAPTSW
jgi:hypothetical protein